MIQADPSGRFVLHVDLGLDRIFVWKFDERSGVLTPNDPPAVSLPPGDGPRHFCFHPNGAGATPSRRKARTSSCSTTMPPKGRLAARQTISSLPPGFAGSNFCSEIMVSGDGRFVYAGNRLHDSIGIFSVGSSGELTFVGEEWTRGNYPRSFNFDPTGQFLYSLQSARRQRRGLPRGSQHRPTGLHRPLHSRRQSIDHRVPRPRQAGMTPAVVRPRAHDSGRPTGLEPAAPGRAVIIWPSPSPRQEAAI